MTSDNSKHMARGKSVDVSKYAGDTVRLSAHITRVMSTPTIFEGEVSDSGKTISAEHPNLNETYRLDTEKIMKGDPEFRGSVAIELYNPDRFQRIERANKAPGPQAGTDKVTPKKDLPKPTHEPVS